MHAICDQGLQDAIAAGVHSIQHGTISSDESVRGLVEKGIPLTPTYGAPHRWHEIFFGAEDDEAWGVEGDTAGDFVRSVRNEGRDSVMRAHAAGVQFSFGSDAGFMAHGMANREFSLLHELGLSLKELLISATSDNADILEVSSITGRIKPGLHADIIASVHDPLTDIEAYSSISFVMKSGTVVKHDSE